MTDENQVNEEIKEEITGIARFFPLFPIWFFLAAIWGNYSRLIVLYPGNPIKGVGVAVTFVAALVSTLYVMKVLKKKPE